MRFFLRGINFGSLREERNNDITLGAPHPQVDTPATPGVFWLAPDLVLVTVFCCRPRRSVWDAACVTVGFTLYISIYYMYI